MEGYVKKVKAAAIWLIRFRRTATTKKLSIGCINYPGGDS